MGTPLFIYGNVPLGQSLQVVNQIAQIIGVILVVLYVIFTYKTFKQIKKQTDYQQDAYLRVYQAIVKELPQSISFAMGTGLYIGGQPLRSNYENYSYKYINNDLHDKLKAILKPIFPLEDSVFDGNFYTLVLTNYGNAPVKEISLHLDLIIQNSQDLIEKKMLKGSIQYEINIKVDEIITRDGEIKIPIISTAAFPIYTIKLSGKYFDVRDIEYELNQLTLKGENEHLLKIQ